MSIRTRAWSSGRFFHARTVACQIEGPNLPYRRGAETALCNTAKSGGRGPVGVKTRMPPECSHVSFGQLRTSRPMRSIPPCANSGHEQMQRFAWTAALLDHLIGTYKERF